MLSFTFSEEANMNNGDEIAEDLMEFNAADDFRDFLN